MKTFSRHLAALAVAACVAVLVASLVAGAIERRSLRDVSRVLRLTGNEWASVAVDGLQVRVSGTAPDESGRFKALAAAGTVVDAARVIDEIAVADKQVIAPDFSIEILRNKTDVSLIGLVPGAMDRAAFVAALGKAVPGGAIADLLESAGHPPPDGWERAVTYGLRALGLVARAKISVAPDLVRVSGVADSVPDQRRLEGELRRAIPDGLRVEIDITAPRPAITPFTLRFVLTAEGEAGFDACSADSDQARERIVAAGAAAGIKGTIACTIGLGAPSPRWADAAELAIRAVGDLKGGAVTMSDADVSLIALEGTDRTLFDTVAGTLENRLPEGFSLTAVLPEKEEAPADVAKGPPEFVATLAADGTLAMRGRVRDQRQQKLVDGYAKALFGAAEVRNATRLDEAVPGDWPVRVMAALESLKGMAEGSTRVLRDRIEVRGRTGDAEARAAIARRLSAQLGDGANFDLAVAYDPKLDATLGLPSAEECVSDINAAIAANKIAFAPGSAAIEPGAAPTLDRIAELMKNCADYPMEIGGHTDSQGRDEMNLALSQARAESVLDALLGRRVLVANLTARGYGETEPVADNGTEEGREANRRIAFRLTGAPAASGPGDAEAESAGADTSADDNGPLVSVTPASAAARPPEPRPDDLGTGGQDDAGNGAQDGGDGQ